MSETIPVHPNKAFRGMVCSADQLAAEAGRDMLVRGGSAADAAVAAAAAMAVVGPHFCGIGGDLLAIVRPPQREPTALMAIGRAGSGADPARLRAEGHRDMPLRADVRAVTVPGAVDGWIALHQRWGRLPLPAVLEPAIGLATEGFIASPLLFLSSPLIADVPGADELCPHGPLREDAVVRLPGIARTLTALAERGREGVYGGEFGRALLDLGGGEFQAPDLTEPLDTWVEPLRLQVWGRELWTVPPPSQGYLTLCGAWLVEQTGLVEDPSDPDWPHVLMSAAEVAGRDRPEVLFEQADGEALLSSTRLEDQLSLLMRTMASRPPSRTPSPLHQGPAPSSAGAYQDGDTTHLCALDADGLGVSLTQSNALDFGAHLVAGRTGVFLHNRGVGFCLEPGHPNEYRARRRPAHTLSPAAATGPEGSLLLLGTMGGDAQPQILLQLLARVLWSGQEPATAMAAARVVLDAPGAPPFRLWAAPARSLRCEGHAPDPWRVGLAQRGHEVQMVGALDPVGVGHAQIISADPWDGGLLMNGASDPRAVCGACLAR